MYKFNASPASALVHKFIDVFLKGDDCTSQFDEDVHFGSDIHENVSDASSTNSVTASGSPTLSLIENARCALFVDAGAAASSGIFPEPNKLSTSAVTASTLHNDDRVSDQSLSSDAPIASNRVTMKRSCQHESGCTVMPSFNFPGNHPQRLFCFTHRIDGMIHFSKQRNSKKYASFVADLCCLKRPKYTDDDSESPIVRASIAKSNFVSCSSDTTTQKRQPDASALVLSELLQKHDELQILSKNTFGSGNITFSNQEDFDIGASSNAADKFIQCTEFKNVPVVNVTTTPHEICETTDSVALSEPSSPSLTSNRDKSSTHFDHQNPKSRESTIAQPDIHFGTELLASSVSSTQMPVHEHTHPLMLAPWQSQAQTVADNSSISTIQRISETLLQTMSIYNPISFPLFQQSMVPSWHFPMAPSGLFPLPQYPSYFHFMNTPGNLYHSNVNHRE